MQASFRNLFLSIVMVLGFLTPADSQTLQGLPKAITIENFDDGSVVLTSYPGEDINPSSWQLNTSTTYQGSAYSLRLYGNTWKMESISACTVEENAVWQVAAYIQSESELQGFGVSDGTHNIIYSFAGSEELSFNNWIPVYQGWHEQNQWNIFQLPIADDWLSLYGYLPTITSLIYVNDDDGSSPGSVYFDLITDISEDSPVIPDVTISFTKGSVYNSGGKRYVDVDFFSHVDDPDSQTHDFYWNFGDGSTSNDESPSHTFTVTDDHPYTVFLRVVDPEGRYGLASCSVEVDQGQGTFPVTLNFVGDVMMARNYEYPGGIIPTYGVNAIFQPTKNVLGDAADITVANLECPLTTAWENHPTKDIYFKSSPANITGLTYAGIDIVSIANNHTFDYLFAGMSETMQVLNDNNILFSGAGADSYEAYRPVFYSKKGLNFAFLASSDRTGQYNNAQPFLNAGYNKPGFANLDQYYFGKQIDEVIETADLIVAEWHSGTEYSFDPLKEGDIDSLKQAIDDDAYSPLFAPSKDDIEIRHFAIDRGADLLICHHPHIIQGVEVYKGKLIAHSLGNFAFDLAYTETFPSMILNASANQNGFSEFSITPVYIDDYIPKRAEGGLGLHILDYLAQCSKDLNTYVQVDREDVSAKVILDTLNMEAQDIQIDDTCTFQLVGSVWTSTPVLLERIGSISSVDQIQPQGNFDFRLGRDLIWFGNMEDEGCTLWNLNSGNETWCDTTSVAGNRSIQHIRYSSSPDNVVTNLEKTIISRSSSLKHTLTAYIKTLNAENVTLEVQYFSDRTGYYLLGSQNIGVLVDGTTPWTLYHKELTIPAGTNFFDIRLVSDVPDSGTAYSWFDNVGIICWNAWDQYEIAETIPTPNDFYFLQLKSDHNPGETVIAYTETVYEETQVDIDDQDYEPESNLPVVKCSPNPFNPLNGPTYITFRTSYGSNVNVSINYMNGKSINRLIGKADASGFTTIIWNGRDAGGKIVNPGIYIFQIESNGESLFGKCVVVGD
jgi:poly-gamma-glutamate synthesis protein (capsule biosynthesis protein)